MLGHTNFASYGFSNLLTPLIVRGVPVVSLVLQYNDRHTAGHYRLGPSPRFARPVFSGMPEFSTSLFAKWPSRLFAGFRGA